MASVIRIFFAFGFLATDVAGCVFVIVDMIIAFKFVFTFVALPISVGIYAYIRHPAAAFIAVVIAVFVYMILTKLLHTVSWAVAIIASSVIIHVIAIIT